MSTEPGPISNYSRISGFIRNASQIAVRRDKLKESGESGNELPSGGELYESATGINAMGLSGEEKRDISERMSKERDERGAQRSAVEDSGNAAGVAGEQPLVKTEPQKIPTFINSIMNGNPSNPDSKTDVTKNRALPASPWQLLRDNNPVTPLAVTSPPGWVASNGSPETSKANMALIAQNDALSANQIYWEMYVERRRYLVKLSGIFSDLGNDILTMSADFYTKRAKKMSDVAKVWASTLGDYELDDGDEIWS